MTKFLIGFASGFICSGAITLMWYHGSLRPRFEALKQIATDKLKGVATHL